MRTKPFNVLFLGRGNSVRSIMAEAVMNRLGAGKFVGYSAGCQPSGVVHSATIDVLRRLEFDTSELRSKGWEEFTNDTSPRMNVVITLSHFAAQESCPLWPGEPIRVDWIMPNPITSDEDMRRLAFAVAYQMINHRIGAFAALEIDSLDSLSLQIKLMEIGRLPQTAPRGGSEVFRALSAGFKGH